jgi:hypothetical protein
MNLFVSLFVLAMGLAMGWMLASEIQKEYLRAEAQESVKAEVEALRSALVWEQVKVQQLESVLARRSEKAQESEKVQMSEKAKETALKKGWGWVLGQEN